MTYHDKGGEGGKSKYDEDMGGMGNSKSDIDFGGRGMIKNDQNMFFKDMSSYCICHKWGEIVM